MLVSMLFGLIVGLPALRLRADYFAIATIAMAEVVRLFAQNARDLTGGNQGIFCEEGDASNCYPNAWADVSDSINDVISRRLGRPRLPAPAAARRSGSPSVSPPCSSPTSRAPPGGACCGRSARTRTPRRALGKNTLLYKLQSLAIAAALGSIAGFFLALNLSYRPPDRLRAAGHLLRLQRPVLGGLASYRGVAVGAILFWTVLEGTRFIDLPTRVTERGSPRCASRSSGCC